jgi:ABC-type antimicrobial peptide transport system permease subunit
MAVGAPRRAIVALVASEGARLACAGIAAGVAIAVAATRLMASQLYGVSATDPRIFAGVCAILVVVSALAAAMPALRATAVDPAAALHRD